MSSDWPEVTLADVTSKLGDGLHGTPNYDDNGEYYFINGNNLGNGQITIDAKTKRASKAEYLKHKKELNDRTILVSINGTIGNVALYKAEKVFLGKSACYFNVKNDVDKQFIRYVVTSDYFQNYISSLASGSTIKNVSLKLMRNFTFQLPPLKTQKQISKILEDLDNKIELNRQTNQTLEQIAQALFKSWFVDFDPVKAKIQALENGQDPEEAAMAAISGKTQAELDQLTPEQSQTLKQTAALFPDKLVDSELGEVPEGWENQPLSSWGEIICGKTPPKKNEEFYGGNIPFIKIPDMHGNMFVVKTFDSLTSEGAKTQIKKLIPEGSVCVSCIATVGQVVISSEDCFTNQQINTIVPLNKSTTSYLYFSMLDLYDYLNDLASGGSATLNLNTGNFAKILINKPTDEILKSFSLLVEPLMTKVLANYHQQEALKKIRDSLLPKLLSGELSVDKNLNA
jgi:type I restriction enzyme S subunit